MRSAHSQTPAEESKSDGEKQEVKTRRMVIHPKPQRSRGKTTKELGGKEENAHEGRNDLAKKKKVDTRQVLRSQKRRGKTMTRRCRTLEQRRVITGAGNLTGHLKQRSDKTQNKGNKKQKGNMRHAV